VQPLHDPLADADLIRDRGSVLAYAGVTTKLEVTLEQVLEVYQRIYGPRELAVANVLTNLAVVGAHQYRLDEATVQLETALELRREALGDGPGVADEILNLAGVAALRGDAESSAEWAREARRIYGEHLGPQAPKTLDSELMLGMALASAEQFEEAKVIYEDVLARQRRLLGERHPDLRRVAAALGRLLVRMGHGSRAIAPLQLALDLELELAEQGGGDPKLVASLQDELASARAEAVR
jgi:tetratricopeptide (TPR) repeat protein